MAENIEDRGKNQLWEGKGSQKGQGKKSQRIECWRLKCYKKWVTRDHESVNHPVVACRGVQYLGNFNLVGNSDPLKKKPDLKHCLNF